MKLRLLFLFLSLLFADDILLKNGKILNGYLVSRDLEYITFRTDKSNHVFKVEDVALANFSQNYTRIENEHLQTKIITLEKDGKQFTFCSMVHVGNKSFYRKVESILDKNDLVLFEAFGIPDNKDFSTWKLPPKKYNAHPIRYEGDNSYFEYVSKILGLHPQIEELQTDKPFWEPSDFSYDMFRFYLHKRQIFKIIRGEKEYVDLDQIQKDKELSVLFEFVLENKKNKNFHKYVINKFARDIVDGENEKLTTYLEVILLDRNQQVLQDIYECLLNEKLKNVGVCYGAYHSKDIVDNLMKNGFVFVSETWANAWDLR